MNNIESIIKRIADDAQAQAQQKIDEAQAEAKQILADYEQQAKTLSQQTQERAQKEAAVIAERVESQSGLIRRNMMLQYKRQAIEQAFQKALEVLCAQENDKQVELLSSAAAKYMMPTWTILPLVLRSSADCWRVVGIKWGSFLSLTGERRRVFRYLESLDWDFWCLREIWTLW